jgi:4-hydroxybenzoate polyprenyltransferase
MRGRFTFFVRPDQWWYYKIPPPIMLLVLLLAGRASGSDFLLALAALVTVIALVCNFGYAINDLFDVEEDARTGKENAVSRLGASGLTFVAVLSAFGSLAIAALAIGEAGAALTLCALLLPLAYSMPPLRIKERKWIGVLADATAAHVYPAILCVVIASQWSGGGLPGTMIVAVVLWSLMLGLRGILSHQLLDADVDRESGLITVVHDHGAGHIVKGLKYGVAPIEIASLITVVLQSNVGAVFWCAVLIYAVTETLRTVAGHRVLLFSKSGSRYVPFLGNNFYQVWGPLAVMADVAAGDRQQLLLPLLFVALFWRRVFGEAKVIAGMARNTVRALGSRLVGTRPGS